MYAVEHLVSLFIGDSVCCGALSVLVHAHLETVCGMEHFASLSMPIWRQPMSYRTYHPWSCPSGGNIWYAVLTVLGHAHLEAIFVMYLPFSSMPIWMQYMTCGTYRPCSCPFGDTSSAGRPGTGYDGPCQRHTHPCPLDTWKHKAQLKSWLTHQDKLAISPALVHIRAWRQTDKSLSEPILA